MEKGRKSGAEEQKGAGEEEGEAGESPSRIMLCAVKLCETVGVNVVKRSFIVICSPSHGPCASLTVGKLTSAKPSLTLGSKVKLSWAHGKLFNQRSWDPTSTSHHE